MDAKHWLRSLLGLLGLVGGLLSMHGHAGDSMTSAGRLLWDMGDIYRDFSDQRMTRRMSAEALDRLAERAADKLASRRDSLAELLPDLLAERQSGKEADMDFAKDLKHFLDTWPDAAAFKASLLREGKQSYEEEIAERKAGRALGLELGGLKGAVDDPRWKWKTPFPLFRP